MADLSDMTCYACKSGGISNNCSWIHQITFYSWIQHDKDFGWEQVGAIHYFIGKVPQQMKHNTNALTNVLCIFSGWAAYAKQKCVVCLKAGVEYTWIYPNRLPKKEGG